MPRRKNAGRARRGRRSGERPFVYSRRWRAETDADAARFEAEGRQGVVRLLMPREGQFVLNDLIRGEVRVDWASEQDHVIQRADGTCLYHLATVVDDHDMQISHVIRAEEHLSNTPRQVFMFERLGYALPHVRPPAVRRRAGQQDQAQQAQARQVSQEPRLRRS